MTLPVSANVGFLWEHLPLPERIRAAQKAGFDAVECHFPYAHAAEDIAAVLRETKTPMLGINTALGPKGAFGLAALAGREVEARSAIDQAVAYAVAIDARHVNVVAGLTDGGAEAERTFRENLAYACARAEPYGLGIVIEPLNPRSVPGAHLSRQEAAIETIHSVGAPNLKLMLDFYHAQIVEGDLETLIHKHLPFIGHVQFAAVHDRGEPDMGEVNFNYLFRTLEEAGYRGFLGAEYKPRGVSVEAGLAWLTAYRGR